MELATGQEHQIGGDDFLTSTGAKWTPDGKKLLFLGGIGAVRHGFTRALHFAALQRIAHSYR